MRRQGLRRGVEAGETVIGDWMPRRFLLRYDAAFGDRLLAEAKTLRRRLDEGRAAGWASARRPPVESEDLEALRSLSFEDYDFEWLYSLSHDGVTDAEQAHGRFRSIPVTDARLDQLEEPSTTPLVSGALCLVLTCLRYGLATMKPAKSG